MAPAQLKPLRDGRSLALEITERLRELIVAGEFGFGERLVEAQIARDLGVSRGPVREAVAQLRAEGLAREEPRRGSFVVTPTVEDIIDIYDLRAAIETHAVRTLIHRDPGRALAVLSERVEGIAEAARRADERAVAKADLEFHDALCELTGNSRLLAAFRSQASIIQALLVVEEREHFPELAQVVDHHRGLLEAFESRDPEKAATAWRRHLQDAADRLSATYRARMED